jgi:Fe2+ transport system protein B
MASRTIESDRDRKMTIMTTTFIPCGAKLPIIALIAGAFFDNAGWVAWSAYFVGVAAIVCSGIILKKTKMFAGDPAPFVMELPAYHWPTVGNIQKHVGAWLVFHQKSRYDHHVINHHLMVLDELRMDRCRLWYVKFRWT